MLTFFIEGGWGMIPITVLGTALLVLALREGAGHTGKDDPRVPKLAVGLGVVATYATWTNLAAVLHYVSDESRVAASELERTLLVGLFECTRPFVLAGAFILAIGMLRAARGWRRPSPA